MSTKHPLKSNTAAGLTWDRPFGTKPAPSAGEPPGEAKPAGDVSRLSLADQVGRVDHLALTFRKFTPSLAHSGSHTFSTTLRQTVSQYRDQFSLSICVEVLGRLKNLRKNAEFAHSNLPLKSDTSTVLLVTATGKEF